MRIHLILRSMWPKRAHLEDVHVGVVELIGLGDEACPAIPRIKGLLRGVAMEMRVSCCLCSTHTPVLPRIRFGADLRRRKRRARRSNTLLRQLTRLLRAARTLLFGFTWSIQRPCPSCRSATKRIEPFGRTRTGALAHDIGYSRKLPLKSPNACHIASLGFLFANFRPPRRAGGLARGERGPGRGPLAGWGAYGRGGGEVQVAAALALVSACFSAHRQGRRRILGGSGSGVVGWGGWAR